MHRQNLLFVSTLALALFGSVRSVPLHKRFAGDATFYDTSVGIGACGDSNQNSDLICAINAPQYDGSCNKAVRITGPKGSVTCTIKDKCPECKFGSIDMTPAAFDQIADASQGRVQITWNFVDGPEPEPEPEPKTPPPPPPPPPSNPPSPPPSDPIPPPRSDIQEDPKPKAKHHQKDTDNGDDAKSSATVHSVSFAFISGDFSLINGGKLVMGGNPLHDPEGYSDEIINNVTDASDDVDQTGNGTDPTDDVTDQSGDAQTPTTDPSETQYY